MIIYHPNAKYHAFSFYKRGWQKWPKYIAGGGCLHDLKALLPISEIEFEKRLGYREIGIPGLGEPRPLKGSPQPVFLL